jgi:hypothetical protein
LLEPVRHSWATGESITWTKVHDLPDFVYFNHEIHVNKGIGCSSCHGRVDLMPIMYEQNTLQMEWCLNCHRDPAKNLRPTSEIYNMAWTGPSTDSPVWCGTTGMKTGVPTAQAVTCTNINPTEGGVTVAALQFPAPGEHQSATVNDAGTASLPPPPVSYAKFTDQAKLGHFLAEQYHIRNPRELSSCDTCHR